jgi:hypothetical protein
MAKSKKNVSPSRPQPQSQLQATVKPPVVPVTAKQPPAQKTGDFAFNKTNYKIMFIGLGFIVLGFILMIGGGSKDPNVFNPAIFDFQRLTLAPLLIITGYVIEIVAIMKKPKD